MSWFYNLKTSAKLFAAFGLLAIILGFVGFYGLNNMNQINTQLKFMYDERLIPISDIAGAQVKYQQIRVNIRDMNLVAVTPEDKKNYDDEIKQYQKDILASIDKYSKTYMVQEETDLINKFTPAWDAYNKKLDEAVRYGYANQPEEYKKLAPSFKVAGDNLENVLKDIISLNIKFAEKSNADANALYASSRTVTIVIIVLALIISAVSAIVISRIIATPLIQMAGVAQRIADGDLSSDEIEVKSKDEIGDLGNAFNRMIRDLRAVIREIRDASMQVAASSEELSAGADETTRATEQISAATQQMASGSENQLKSITNAASAVHQMSAGIQQVNANSEEVSQLSLSASRAAKDGVESVNSVLSQMNEINVTVKETADIIKNLGQRSQEIGNIVGMITDIASQTNLLALNAAIEAARAGEMGRGFAVVADEVRKLAEQSANSAQQIAELITEIQKETDNAVVSMQQGTQKVTDGLEKTQQVNESFQLINGSVSNVTGKVQQVSASIEQIATGSQQIVTAIEVVSKSAEDSAAASQQTSAASEEQLATMEEVAAAAQSLSRLAENMQAVLSRFKL